MGRSFGRTIEHTVAWAIAAALLPAIGSAAFAATTTVYNITGLRNALNAAAPGAGGSYTSRLWVSGRHGTADNMIEVVALDPTDRPLFTVQDAACFTLYDCSYIMVDGIMSQAAGTAISAPMATAIWTTTPSSRPHSPARFSASAGVAGRGVAAR